MVSLCAVGFHGLCHKWERKMQRGGPEIAEEDGEEEFLGLGRRRVALQQQSELHYHAGVQRIWAEGLKRVMENVMRTMRRFGWMVGINTVLILVMTAQAARGADGVAPEQATFAPGKETKILDPKAGGVGGEVVYVPEDY